jgi:PhnB protein
MASSAAKKTAVTGKRRAAAIKAAATRKRRAAASNTPAVIPMLSYEDGIAALKWLTKVFGFRERCRLLAPDGRLSHAEMEAGDGLIMLASPTPDYQCPKRHREVCAQARKWSSVPWIIDGVLVFVDDLDAHFTRAKAAGATILSGIEDGPPGRRYRAEDLEGHRWFFFEKDEG